MRAPFFTALFLIYVQSFAQQWQPAKIVVASADTLIGYASWSEGTTILFKSQQGGSPVKKFTNRDANMIYLGGETYASSYFLKLTTNNGNPVADSAFLKILISGDINLYFNANTGSPESPTTFVFQRKNSSAVELMRKTTVVKRNGLEYTQVLNFYRNQLQNEVKDCPEMVLPKRNFYTENEMTGLVRQYITCKGISAKVVKKEKHYPIEISLLTGLDFSGVKFHVADYGSQYYTNIPSGNNSSSKPFFGVQAFVPGKTGRVGFITEAVYKTTDLAMTTSTASTTFSIKYIRFNLGGRYSIPIQKKLNLDFTGSLTISPLVSKKYSSSMARDVSFRAAEIGYCYGAGLRWNNRVSLFIRNESVLFGGFTQGSLSANCNYLYVGTAIRVR